MRQLSEIGRLRSAVEALRRRGPVALVPTMGALHEGHLTLVREARRRAGSVVVSIFVNPTQFGPNEDLAAYPRRLVDDAEALAGAGVAVLWAPTVEVMYPAGFATSVRVAGVSEGLCGAVRPGHFAGVATVVLKLFNQVRPDLALFGEKDWQQLAVIRRMARDLDLTHPAVTSIIGVPTVREADNLAMSSRNAYLSPEDRERAAILPAVMQDAAARIAGGAEPPLVLGALQQVLLQKGFASVDYAVLADAESLAPLDRMGEAPARLFVAARIGGTRLIDNIPVGPA